MIKWFKWIKITLDITLEEKIWLLNQQEKVDSAGHKEEEKDQILVSEESTEDQKVNLIQDQNHLLGNLIKITYWIYFNLKFIIFFYRSPSRNKYRKRRNDRDRDRERESYRERDNQRDRERVRERDRSPSDSSKSRSKHRNNKKRSRRSRSRSRS